MRFIPYVKKESFKTETDLFNSNGDFVTDSIKFIIRIRLGLMNPACHTYLNSGRPPTSPREMKSAPMVFFCPLYKIIPEGVRDMLEEYKSHCVHADKADCSGAFD